MLLLQFVYVLVSLNACYSMTYTGYCWLKIWIMASSIQQVLGDGDSMWAMSEVVTLSTFWGLHHIQHMDLAYVTADK